MWFIGVEVEQETSALSPKKIPGSAPESTTKRRYLQRYLEVKGNNYCQTFLRIAPNSQNFAIPVFVCKHHFLLFDNTCQSPRQEKLLFQ